MWSRVLLLFLASLALVALPVGAAEPVHFDMTGHLPLRADGAAATDAEAAPTLLVQQTRGTFEATLTTARVHLVSVEHWEEVTPWPYSGHSGVRTQERILQDVTLRLDERLEGFTLLAWTDSGAARTEVAGVATSDPEDPAWTTDADLRLFGLSKPLDVTAPVDRESVDATLRETVLGRPLPFHYTIPADSLHLQAADAVHTLSGELGVYLSGARIGIQHDRGTLDLLATETLERRPGSIYLPDQGWTGPGEHEERIVRYVQMVAEPASLVVRTQDAPAALYSKGFALDLNGHLAVPRATGTLHFEDGARTVDLERLILSGDVRAHVASGEKDGTARLEGAGDVTYVRVGGEAERFSSGVAAAAGLAVVAALALAAWQQGLLVPLFSRLKRSDVLDHETRRSLYEVVKAEPGVTPHDLVAHTGVGWSTVTYHLGVLERNDLVIAVRDGRYRRFFDRTTGRYANGRKQVVAALKNETTAAIACSVRDEPGLVQRRLAERFGLAASSVHWHITRLVAAGLVVKERRAQSVALVPGPAWSQLEEEDLEAVMGPTTKGGATPGGATPS